MDQIKTIFERQFHMKAHETYVSPGRVNIIGGHTDYNGGHVLPFCIDMGISAAISYRKDSKVFVYSENFSDLGILSFHLKSTTYDTKRDYANYISGVYHELLRQGYPITKGMNIALSSNLPVGGGLSSSASLLVLIVSVLNDQFHLGLTGPMVASIAKRVENEYIGVSCGIMDQFIIANGRKNHVMFLNTTNLHYELISINLSEYAFVLVNSNITRKLTESKYNIRQSESSQVLRFLQEHVKIDHVCDLRPEDYDTYEPFLPEETLKKRFRHLINENARVIQAKDAIKRNDFPALGALLNEAHTSVRDLYEVSSEVLDELVTMARDAGSIGSKMIGGGFGGSTLNLVKRSELEIFWNNFTELYQTKYNKSPVMHIVSVEDGVRRNHD
ncbi:MAG: galactokinase [Bacilli bacterium]|nr:galactokinase [Bacilli bacterium]MBN2876080.1 galactokinase [Bacilli bacterium]